MDGPHLIYFADPMCSWCYGFSRVIDEIRAGFAGALPIRLVMGGLRPGAEQPVAEAAKAEIEGRWRQVQEATGLTFDATALRRKGFIYDTDPAARAVVVARREDPDLAVRYLGRVQSAFYGEGRDVTRVEVLAELVAEFGLDPAAFIDAWSSEAAQQATWRDYAISQHAGVTGFPTLVAGPNEDGVFGVVTRGYAPPAQVVGVLRDWIQRIAA
ncbi:DsbA family protein [Phenylobacterium sp. LjRoot225]|uniref:DsbA family protein n=1 Tax=Phenylobacterium sp. LjRoot225 TaxID=3342285 RepID=UPI003ED0C31A